MTSDDSPRAPLVSVINKHLNNFEIDPWIEENYPASGQLVSWYLLNHHLISNRAETEKHFHEEQLISYHLLFDWWTATYQDTGISLSTILEIVSDSADLEQLAGANWSERLAGVLNHLAPRTFPEREDLLLSRPLLEESYYNSTLLALFHEEFVSSSDEPYFPHVHRARQDAIAAAYTQRAAVNCFTHRTGLKICGSTTTSRDHPIMSSPTIPLDYGPSLECCVWLPPLGDKLHCIPYYLWDVANRETVRTNTFTEFPSYTCISHTWGRSRLNSEARVKGVWWNIPRNSKFEVENLPSLLSNVPTRTPYVWLDLLCIPQDGSTIGAKKIAAQEIARQGEIFRAAQRAVVWLNDVEELDVLSNIMQWMVLRFLQIPKESEEQRSLSELRDQAWKNIAGKSTNLFAAGAVHPPSAFDLNPWFTSLWTLQEVCLRPDMWLCSRDWSFLSIDGETALPLDGLICIHKRFRRYKDNEIAMFDERNERADNQGLCQFEELGDFMIFTGFNRLLNISQVGIFALGDGRDCTERRAEAIMSVLDVTDWYRPGESNDRELVLGKYPLAFVEELKRKIPGEFFSAFIRHSNYFSLSQDQKDKVVPYGLLGSLLPIGLGFGHLFQDVTHGDGWYSDHPSLYSWTIDSPNGHVHIERACIVSPPGKGLECAEEVFGAYVDCGYLIPASSGREERWEENLHAWVRSFRFPIYCVATRHRLYEDLGTGHIIQVQGIVLGQFVGGSLFKLGSFMIFMQTDEDNVEGILALLHYVSRDEEVNWTVL